MARTVRIGVGSWPSALPLAWPLRQGLMSWPFPVGELAFADAAEIDERMDLRTLTAGLVSPEAYLRHQDLWVCSRTQALCAVAPGAQAAVLLSRHPLETLDGTVFAVPPAAGGEGALLEALLRADPGIIVSTIERRGHLETLLADHPATLLVGERALLSTQRLPEGVIAHDLTDRWLKATHLPYPVGLWAAERAWAEDHPDTWRDLQVTVGQAKDLGLLMLDALVTDWCRQRPLPPDVLRAHLACFRYDAPPDLPAALRRFAELSGSPPPEAWRP